VEELRREAVVLGRILALASPMEGGFCISYRLFSNISHPSSSVGALHKTLQMFFFVRESQRARPIQVLMPLALTIGGRWQKQLQQGH